MKSRKQSGSKPPQSSNAYRWVIGGLVVIGIVLILGFKLVEREDAEDLYAVQERMETLAAPTPFLAEPTIEKSSAQSPIQEPMPADPAGQIEWAVGHAKPSLVFFHSTTCKPCQVMEELVAEVRGDYEPQIVFVDVIVTDRANMALIRQARIMSIPTTFFVDATGQGRGMVGAMSEEDLRAELDRLLRNEG